MTKYIVDNHAHPFHNAETTRGESLFETFEGKHTAQQVLKTCQKKATKLASEGTSLLVALPNINQDNLFYEWFVNDVLTNSNLNVEVDDTYKDVFIKAKLKRRPINGKWSGERAIIFARANEVTTPQGHILLLFGHRNAAPRSLDYVLKEAENETNAIKIADHPLLFDNEVADYTLARSSSPKKMTYKINKTIADKLSRGRRLSLGLVNLISYKDKLEAVEAYNSYCLELSELTCDFAKQLKLPVTGGSDAHSAFQFFTTYMIMDLQDSSPEALRASYRRELKKENPIIVPNPHSPFEIYVHGILTLGCIVRQFMGLTKKQTWK